MAYINGNEVLFSANVTEAIEIDDALNAESENAVQNKVVTQEINGLEQRMSNAENMIFALDNDYATRLSAIEAKLGM